MSSLSEAQQAPRARSFMAADVEEQSEEEKRWVGWVEKSLRHETAEALGAAAKVFAVPRSLRDTNPEAYAPHVFSLGPYHHQARPELADMQRFKLAGAKRFETHLAAAAGHTIEHLKDRLLAGGALEVLRIRATYHRFLDLNDTTLAWLMAVDACFLLDFIENYRRRRDEATATAATADVLSSSANWVNAVVRDAMMLENQVPLFVLARALELRHRTRREAAEALRAVVLRFVIDVSPFKTGGGDVDVDNERRAAAAIGAGDLAKHAHLLEVLYRILVPDAALLDDGGDQVVVVEAEEEAPATAAAAAADGEEVVVSHDDDDGDDVEAAQQVIKKPTLEEVKQTLSQASRLDVAPVRFVRKNLVNLVGKITRKAPALAALLPVLGKLMQSVNMETQLTGGGGAAGEGAMTTAPRADEISIPSVEELAERGVRFTAAAAPPEGGGGGIAEGIAFDRATATLRLPAITLDANTEVVLRNLVAYEAVAVRGPLVLARYTELMNGVVDAAADVEILRRSGVVAANRMKSDGEAAGMWNGMARAARLTRVPRIDAAVAAVNAHRGRSAAARARRALRRYVFRSWKMLTLLASVGLLLMTALQTFCAAYPCERQWFGVMVLPPGTADEPPQ